MVVILAPTSIVLTNELRLAALKEILSHVDEMTRQLLLLDLASSRFEPDVSELLERNTSDAGS